MGYLYTSPQVLTLLQDAKEHPEDDTPRLVLADWLDEHGDPDRAEFIRLQCRLAWGGKSKEASDAEKRCGDLLDRHGGAWLGSLWRRWLGPAQWHRGLLALRLPSSLQPERIADMLPWIDTVVFVIQGRQGLQRMAQLLAGVTVNHIYIDLRRPLGENGLLDALALVQESRSLRSLSIDWPMHLQCWRACEGGQRITPTASERFLSRLIGECPFGRHLTHLGSSPPFSDEQKACLRSLGVQPADALDRLWMQHLPAIHFALKRNN